MKLKILAIETSCDDTSVAIVDDLRTVLAMKTVSQLKDHAKFGGVVPEIASRHHEESILEASFEALRMANLKISDIDAVAVTSCPGLVGSILVGTSFAKGISIALGVPLIFVNHIEAHACSCLLEHRRINPPFLSLVISGGHTSIIDVENYNKYVTYFYTVDDAVGEILDKVARSLGINYPGGAHLDKMAQFGNKNKFKMPVPKIQNFSFSGIKTWALNICKNVKNDEEKNDLSASLLFGISEYVSEKLVNLAKSFGRTMICLGGGVAASQTLQSVLEEKCNLRKINLSYPSPKYCSDNAAMIGIRAILSFNE